MIVKQSVEDVLRSTRRFDDAAASAAAASAAAAFVDETGGDATVAYCHLDTPLGTMTAATTSRGLVRLAYVRERTDDVLDELASTISPRILEVPTRLDTVARQLDEYFDNRRTAFDLALDRRLIHGFGKAVLRATQRIPYGSVSSYGEIAAEAGNRRAARAAGSALGANPLPIVIPCHRVLRAGAPWVATAVGWKPRSSCSISRVAPAVSCLPIGGATVLTLGPPASSSAKLGPRLRFTTR
ncbi:MAG: methylated-DNA--[protein]-cysteine S-methyltransferase [Acidimicrobiia bacterium]|nr:methylated-DNA--[protein]-cysteine S-methyltransferase [Acidimicrobiia bacterium]